MPSRAEPAPAAAASAPVGAENAGPGKGKRGASQLAALVREPLVHFLFAGAVLFGGYSWLNRGAQSEPEPIRIGEGEARWVRETFSSQWRRDPTPDEMRDLLTTLRDEELLAREARALGLDQHDTVVRRRLAQKLSFLVEDTARLAEPGEDQLRQFYTDHAERYRSAPRISFRHVFFSPERRPHATAEANAARALLSSAGSDARPTVGDPLALDDAFTDLDPQSLASLFGPDFARSVFALPVRSWSGPVRSAYGTHLVRISSRTQGEVRPFAEVRGAVTEAWYGARQRALKDEYLGALRAKYGVVWDVSARPVPADAPARPPGP
ncbi:peptidyl-prolyl cis-trans isomerase [Methylobacterium sp. CM6257]